MERYSNSLGCHIRYDGYTDKEIIKIYNELNENDDDLTREIFWRIGWDYDEVFHTKDENFNDTLLDVDEIMQKALNELKINIDKETIESLNVSEIEAKIVDEICNYIKKNDICIDLESPYLSLMPLEVESLFQIDRSKRCYSYVEYGKKLFPLVELEKYFDNLDYDKKLSLCKKAVSTINKTDNNK